MEPDDDSQPPDGTVGQGNYEVQQGDCISSIAYENGFFWETLWNHPNNADLKQKRKDPNVLMEGDIVCIPDLTLKQLSGATEKKHLFKKKGVPGEIVLVIRRNNKPVTNTPYTVTIDNNSAVPGKTDGNGKIKLKIPPNAKSGTLRVGAGQAMMIYELALGSLDPITEISGVQDRLANLGYSTEPDERGVCGPMTILALKKFQTDQDLDQTGRLDDQTKQKLQQLHGC